LIRRELVRFHEMRFSLNGFPRAFHQRCGCGAARFNLACRPSWLNIANVV